MMWLQASRHQGSPEFRNRGRQCVANSVYALARSLDCQPSQWTEDTLNEILNGGDKLYETVKLPYSYWSSDDIPSVVNNFKVNVEEPLHGTLKTKVGFTPFFSMKKALSAVLCNDVSRCILTIGKNVPSYTSAIIKYGQIYHFDPHSRNSDGMSVADGFATLTACNSIDNLVSFIGKLSDSLFTMNNDEPFEISKINFERMAAEDSNDSDTCTEFSGFSEESEADAICRLYVAQEYLTHVQMNDESDISDISSVFSDNSLISDEIDSNGIDLEEGLKNSSFILNDSFLDETLKDVKKSLHSFDENVFFTCSDPAINANEANCMTDVDNNMSNQGSEFQNLEMHDNVYGIDIAVGTDHINVDNVGNADNMTDNGEHNYDNEDEDDIPLIRFVKNRPPFNDVTSSQTINHANKHLPLINNSNKEKATRFASNTLESGQRSRKTFKNVDEWKRNIMKRRKNEGKHYVTRAGNIKGPRSLKPGCGFKCRFQCHTKMTEEKRKNVFHYFWALGNINHQRNFILKFTQIRKKKQKTGISDRRKNSYTYILPLDSVGTSKVVKVCKTFFLQTLSVSDRYVSTAHKISKMGVCPDDNRGKHDNRPNKTTLIQAEQIRSHIESFPTVESHYCRKDSNKEYLSSDLNVIKMYYLNKEKCYKEGCLPVSVSVYRKIFNREYNISFHKPTKDQCDLCMTYNNGNSQSKANLKVEYDKHILNKILVRETKEKNKLMCKNDSSVMCACFDLQEILLTPKSFESCLYYKRRLNTFNFSIYDLSNKNAFCYVWNESISGRGACEMASCVLNFIQQHALQGKKKFIFYSDNCSAQNKNKFLLTMYWYCMAKYNLESIIHQYLEKGHTQNENDSVHATIESASKHIKVFTTAQWASIIRMARRENPYNVKEMSLKDFFDFKSIASNIKNFEINTESQKVVWKSIKSLKLTSEKPNCFYYKTMHNGEEVEVDFFKRLRSEPPIPNLLQLKQLRHDEIPISKDKFADLLYLCRMQIIPSVHHAFYLLLPHDIE